MLLSSQTIKCVGKFRHIVYIDLVNHYTTGFIHYICVLAINQMVVTGVAQAFHSNEAFLTPSLSLNLSSRYLAIIYCAYNCCNHSISMVLTHFGPCQPLPYTYFKSLANCSLKRIS